MKNNYLFRLARWSFYLFFAFLPFQIDALVVSGEIYFSGFFNPYLSHFIYLSDIFLVVSLLFLALSMFFSKGKKRKKQGSFKFDLKWSYLYTTVLVFFGAYVLSVFLAVDKVNSLIYCIRLFEFLVVFYLIANKFVDIKRLIYIFIGVVSFEAFIGIFQYVLQESLGLRFFGEPVISSNTLGVAKVGLFDKNVLRVYGTFPHPNIFAGYLVFAIMFIIYCYKDSKWIFSLLLIVCLLALVLTFSRSAFLALFVGLLVYFTVSKVRPSVIYILLILSLLLFFVMVFDLPAVITERLLLSDVGISERGLYLSISERMFFDNVFGVGAGNFTSVMQEYSNTKLMPWLYQPVHNMFLLMLNEIGIQGVLAFLIFFVYLFVNLMEKLKKRSKYKDKHFVHILMSLWISILIIGLFDHYFISLYQGQALLLAYGGFVGMKSIK